MAPISEEEYRERILAQYEPVGIIMNVYFEVHGKGFKEQYYLRGRGEYFVDFEPIINVKSIGLGHYNFQVGERVLKLGEPEYREYVWRSMLPHDTVIYRRKAQ